MVTKYYLIIDLWLSLMTDDKVKYTNRCMQFLYLIDFGVLKLLVFFFELKELQKYFWLSVVARLGRRGKGWLHMSEQNAIKTTTIE